MQYGGTDFDIKTKKASGDLDGRAKGVKTYVQYLVIHIPNIFSVKHLHQR